MACENEKVLEGMRTAQIVPKSWGREEILENSDFCCKKLVYEKPIASSSHWHKVKHELFVVASGMFEITIGGSLESGFYGPGDWVNLPPFTEHRVRCIEPGTIIECSTHDDPEDCVRRIPSET